MKTAIGDVMRRCYEKGWITTRDGNISVRQSIDGQISKSLLITPTGMVKHHIHPDDVIKIKLTDTPPENVSIEFDMHLFLQRDAKTTRAVVHVHPTHVVAAMFAGFDLPKLCNQFPEIFRYTKVGPTVAFSPPGSDQLAINTNNYLRNAFDSNQPIQHDQLKFDIVGQDRHGVTAVGRNPWEAYEHIERLDHICEIALKSGVSPKSIK